MTPDIADYVTRAIVLLLGLVVVIILCMSIKSPEKPRIQSAYQLPEPPPPPRVLFVTDPICQPNKPAPTVAPQVPTFQCPPPPYITVFHWSDGGNFDFPVVGTSYSQEHIRSLVDGIDDHGEWNTRGVSCTATLMPYSTNPYDNKAVSVHINGNLIGHLSRENARSFRRRLGAKKLTGKATSCDAVIIGGGLKDGQRKFYGVRLDLKQFD